MENKEYLDILIGKSAEYANDWWSGQVGNSFVVGTRHFIVEFKGTNWEYIPYCVKNAKLVSNNGQSKLFEKRGKHCKKILSYRDRLIRKGKFLYQGNSEVPPYEWVARGLYFNKGLARYIGELINGEYECYVEEYERLDFTIDHRYYLMGENCNIIVGL